MFQLLAIVLAVCLVVVLARYHMLKKALSLMAGSMEEVRETHSRRQLTIGTQQPPLARLAVAVNTLYDDMEADRAENRAAMDEMRQSMANISHDLRTPLTSIIGYLELLQKGGNPPEKATHYLDTAHSKAKALNGLVNGLFEMARLESGGYAFEHTRLDAAALLAEELADAYTVMEQQGAHPEVLLPDTPLWMIGDKAALRRVFGNLLQNMAKHGHAPMRIQACAEDKTAVFRFSNKAPNLTPEDAGQLFQRFFTGDRMRSGQDTGLGLAIVREFAGQMNGSAEAQLQAGILTLTLRWPLAAPLP